MKLKPCPFCGSDMTDCESGYHWTVICKQCFAEGPPAKEKEFAIKMWNERVDLKVNGENSNA